MGYVFNVEAGAYAPGSTWANSKNGWEWSLWRGGMTLAFSVGLLSGQVTELPSVFGLKIGVPLSVERLSDQNGFLLLQIGSHAVLYRTTDAGIAWTIDTW